ncbi:MAG: hydroxymethylglutaryl-CoA reductase, degradative [Nitrososphaeria archaeon]|jgi:hydroxymethylglutaryl-CoA reductase
MGDSRLPGFYKLSREERVRAVAAFSGLSDDEVRMLLGGYGLTPEEADRMSENVIGLLQLPLGVATNFLINGRDYLVPMAIEEPSVIAAASNAARVARVKGGFRASADRSLTLGQIQVVGVPDPHAAVQRVLEHREELLRIANDTNPTLLRVGGGAVDLSGRVIDTERGRMLIIELLVDTKDAMGANTVNTMVEEIAPIVEELAGGRVRLRILSNLATHRMARAWAVFDAEAAGGRDVVEGILDAYAFAAADPYRCATHNKGVMNGVVAVALATGNDTRALEAGAHTYASLGGRCRPLTRWELNSAGDLVGSVEMPMAVGTLGGATSSHPVARLSLKILGVRTAQELASVMAAVALAQNFAALRALVKEGIQRGHMKLHARNLAVMAGATPDILDEVVRRLSELKRVTYDDAVRIVGEVRSSAARAGGSDKS